MSANSTTVRFQFSGVDFSLANGVCDLSKLFTCCYREVYLLAAFSHTILNVSESAFTEHLYALINTYLANEKNVDVDVDTGQSALQTNNFNQHYAEVQRELELEKKRKDMILEKTCSEFWFDEPIDGMDVAELKQYISSLQKLKRKACGTVATGHVEHRMVQAISLCFTGLICIELLADAAISSLVDDNANHVKDLSLLKEHVKPKAHSCDNSGIKEAIVSRESDNWNDRKDKSVDPSKELRLHWDLYTMMDEWVEPCDDLVAKRDPHDSCVGGVKFKLEGCKNRCAEAVGFKESC
ncbi:hypothetical protein Tco_0696231 [Tanacetum coccineum]